LKAAGAEAGGFGEVDEALVRKHQPEVAAASGVGGVSEVIAENGDDREKGVGDCAVEFVRDGRLGDEDDWIGEWSRVY
jgi:hypothetical protein